MEQAVPPSAVLTVLKDVVEGSELFSDLWVVAEISNATVAASGHRYFSLKDDKSALRGVMFAQKMAGYVPKNGERVLAHGRLTVYVARGELSFQCDFIRPEGIGLLAAKYEELKARLEAEGLFDRARKRPLPLFPTKVGVVTSPTGAALQDIIRVLSTRWPLAELVVSPTLVQGDQAPGQIVAALRSLEVEPDLDLVIVARGGGSIEDLWAFNDEQVARAIFRFPVPVVSGVGHETDETIADLVADLRAPTPSAAAMRSTPDRREIFRGVVNLSRDMANGVGGQVSGHSGDVQRIVQQLNWSAPDLEQLERNVAERVTTMHRGLERRCGADRARFEGLSATVAALDPRATLARGFAIVQEAGSKQRVVSSIKNVKPGERLTVSVSDGAFWAEVS